MPGGQDALWLQKRFRMQRTIALRRENAKRYAEHLREQTPISTPPTPEWIKSMLADHLRQELN